MILVPVPLTADAFADCGHAFGLSPAGVAEVINDGTTRRHTALAQLDLRGAAADPVVHVYEARARTFPLALRKLERHREADQVFVPLGSQRFVVVVAGRGDTFDRTDLRAFVTAPGEAVVLARGCWHHGLLALGDGDRFLVIEGGNHRADTEERDVVAPLLVLSPDA